MPLLIFNVVKSELSKCPLTHSHTQHVSEASKETEKLERTKMIGLNQISATFYFFSATFYFFYKVFFLNGSISLDSGGHFNGESTLHQERTKIIRLNQISASFYFFCQGDF